MAPGPGRRSGGSGTTWTGRSSSRDRIATSPSSGTASTGAKRSRSRPRSRSRRLSSPPPTTAPWFDTTRIEAGREGRSPTLVHHQDAQAVGRRGVEIAQDVQTRRWRAPEQRDQARPIEEELAAVEHDEPGAGVARDGEQLVGPDTRQRDPAALAVERDERLAIEQHGIAGLGLGNPARRLAIERRARVRTQDRLKRPWHQDERDREP